MFTWSHDNIVNKHNISVQSKYSVTIIFALSIINAVIGQSIFKYSNCYHRFQDIHTYLDAVEHKTNFIYLCQRNCEICVDLFGEY